MREILFRGKRLDNGEWVNGFYINLGGKYHYILTGELDITKGYADLIKNPIAPSTVGQYTGLTDKNGKRIFEGDVLKIAKIGDGFGRYYSPPLDYPVNVVVKWDLCAWMWETLCEDKMYISFPNAWCGYECKVIGNIHDTPELLEGGNNDPRRSNKKEHHAE